MPLVAFEFVPGIVADDTDTASEGRYVGAHWIRFHRGKAELMPGWEAATSDAVLGVCRGAHSWANNGGVPQVALGTHSHLFAYSGGGLYDITPAGLAAGLADGTGGAGYGTGAYGVGTFGTPSTVEYFPRTWSLDSWGEHLVANPRGGGIYEWALGTSTPAALVANAPARANCIFVTPQRHIVACGTVEEGTGTFNPMLVRWCDQENNTVWTSSQTNQAGEYPLSAGSRIVRALPAAGGNLIWTDEALVPMRYDASGGYVFTFGDPLGTKCGLIGPNAVTVKDRAAYWMAPGGQFYVFQGGAPVSIDCPVRDEVFENLSFVQADKIHAGTNSAASEVWWWYPDRRDGNEVSRYVALNVVDGTWTLGTSTRTAWVDANVLPSPLAVDAGGAIYYHERGHSANGGPLPWSLTTGFVDAGEGDALMHISGLRPDFKNLEGVVQLVVLSRSDPQAAPVQHGPYTITAATQKLDLRITARQLALRWSGAAAPARWRMGSPRFDVKPVGARR